MESKKENKMVLLSCCCSVLLLLDARFQNSKHSNTSENIVAGLTLTAHRVVSLLSCFVTIAVGLRQ